MVQQKIKDYLTEHGIKHQRIVRDTGISQSTWSAIMNGKRKLLADEFFLVCKSLKVPPETFMPDSSKEGFAKNQA